jgi:hypothetical protein
MLDYIVGAILPYSAVLNEVEHMFDKLLSIYLL